MPVRDRLDVARFALELRIRFFDLSNMGFGAGVAIPQYDARSVKVAHVACVYTHAAWNTGGAGDGRARGYT